MPDQRHCGKQLQHRPARSISYCELWNTWTHPRERLHGNLHIAVLYAAPAAADYDVSSAGPTLATRRALRADVLRLDVAEGRHRIETARPPLVWS